MNSGEVLEEVAPRPRALELFSQITGRSIF